MGVEIIAWQMWDMFRPRPVSVNPYIRPIRPLDLAYQACVKDGFKVDWVCHDLNDFATYFAANLMQPLMLHDPPKELGVSIVGGVSKRTLGFLQKVDERPVIVFVDRLDKDSPQTITDPNLHVFRREVGNLVLYEVTPFESPLFIERFYQPGAPSTQP